MDTSPATQPINVDIPPLYCPFPYAIHPQHPEMEQRCLSWLGELGVSQIGPAKALGADLILTRSAPGIHGEVGC